MRILHRYKSGAGAIVTQTIMAVDEPHPRSLASLLLLNDYYLELDEDFLAEHDELQNYLDKRHVFLTNILERHGVLHCHYCTHTNLEIGERLLSGATKNNANPYLATIDHVEPVSSGIDKLDEKNWVVSCRRCNKWKSSMSYDEFITKLPGMLEMSKETSKPNPPRKISHQKKKQLDEKVTSNRKTRRLSLQPAA